MIKIRGNNRKVISLVLIVVMFLGSMLQDTIELFALIPQKKVYSAYYDILNSKMNYTDEGGMGLGTYTEKFEVMPEGIDNYRGLFFADLIDFDGNGIEEFMLMYFKDSEYIYEIWGMDGENAIQLTKVADTLSYGLRSSRGIHLLEANGKTYLYDYDSSYGLAGFEETTFQTLYTVENNQWVEIVQFKAQNKLSYEELQAYEERGEAMPEVGTLENPMVCTITKGKNIKEVSDEEYRKELGAYKLEEAIPLIYLGTWGADTVEIGESLTDMSSKIPELLNRLYEASLPTYSFKDISEQLSDESLMKINGLMKAYIEGAEWRQDYDIQTVTQRSLIEFLFMFAIFNEDKLGGDYNQYYETNGGYIIQEMSDTLANQILNAIFGMTLVLEEEFTKQIGEGEYPIIFSYKDGILTKKIVGDKGVYWHYPQVQKVYEVANNIVLVEVDNINEIDLDYFYDTEDPVSIQAMELLETVPYRKWTEEMKQKVWMDQKIYAILERVGTTEGESYRILKLSHKPLDEAEVTQYCSSQIREPNLTIDYNVVKAFTEPEEYIDYMKEKLVALGDEKPNDLGNVELANYIEYVIKSYSQIRVEVDKNMLKLTDQMIGTSYNQINGLQQQIDDVLKEAGVVLNKDINTSLRIDLTSLKSDRPIRVSLGAMDLEGITFDSISFGIEQEQVDLTISYDSLTNLVKQYENLIIQLEKINDGQVYKLTFLNQDGQVIEKIDYPITVTIPAGSELTTVFATYIGGSDNWGGQYDPFIKTISFDTSYSGEYSVLDQAVEITDIGHLSEEVQQAIYFMVSKGYFEVEELVFRPDSPLDRYEFCKSLVKMFFALDRSLTTSFSDVPQESIYYDFVASGENKNIIKGFEDGTFKGKMNITKEQLIALCARTLVDKKGYVYPENTEEYLGFVDEQSISEWARPEIALAVRSGLISKGGLLLPLSEITRGEAADILYKMFMLLYEVQPAEDVFLEQVPVIEAPASMPIALPIGVVSLVLLGGGLGYIYFKRKKKKVE